MHSKTLRFSNRGTFFFQPNLFTSNSILPPQQSYSKTMNSSESAAYEKIIHLLKQNVEKDITELVDAVRGETDEDRAYMSVLQKLTAVAFERLRTEMEAMNAQARERQQRLEDANRAKEEEMKRLEERNTALSQTVEDLKRVTCCINFERMAEF